MLTGSEAVLTDVGAGARTLVLQEQHARFADEPSFL